MSSQDCRLQNPLLPDVQMSAPEVALCIDRVGVRGLRFPLLLRDRANGSQQTVARADLGVDLPASCKGAHMSRLVEALDAWHEELGCRSMGAFLQSMRSRMQAGRAWAKFSFAYLLRKAAPYEGGSANMAYDCSITGQLDNSGQSFLLGIEVPVMTVCPCSKAISSEGAHSQRALARMNIRIAKFVWLEEFIELAENSASSAVYPLLKRLDEKFVTEQAFSRPAFVEDVTRQIAARLAERKEVLAYEVEVESMESIHNHNAFASISSPAGI